MIRASRALACVSLLLAGCASSSGGITGGITQSNDAGAEASANLPGLDASLATDGRSTADADAGPFCTTALGAASGPATLGDVPLADWCAATAGQVMGWTCGGVTARVAGVCDREFLFDATSGKLVAIVGGCNGRQVCEAGDPGFVPPTDCWSGNVSFGVTNVCADVGIADAGPVGAGSMWTSSAQCPTGYVCAFPASQPCYSFGFCAFADFAHDPTCEQASYCACDGTMTQGCAGAYFLKPVPTRGGSAVCPDGG